MYANIRVVCIVFLRIRKYTKKCDTKIVLDVEYELMRYEEMRDILVGSFFSYLYGSMFITVFL